MLHEIYPGGPADKDGRLQPGDQIVEVNSISLKDVTDTAATQAIRQTLPKVCDNIVYYTTGYWCDLFISDEIGCFPARATKFHHHRCRPYEKVRKRIRIKRNGFKKREGRVYFRNCKSFYLHTFSRSILKLNESLLLAIFANALHI